MSKNPGRCALLGPSASRSNDGLPILAEPAFIAIGSNIEPERNLPHAVELLKRLGVPVRVSRVYQNPAHGDRPQPDFLNAAMLLEVEGEPEAIRLKLRAIESELGRVRTEDKFAPRTIDLDLVILGNRILRHEEITIPDPELALRPHLAIPIAELDPGFRHPETSEPLQTIADRLRPGAKLRLREDVTRRVAEISGQDDLHSRARVGD